jgi:hypothetical protein
MFMSACGRDPVIAPVAPATPPLLGSLVIAIDGLPGTATAQLSVTGPGTYQRTAAGSVTLDSLIPGEYHVRATKVIDGFNAYMPGTDSQSVSVAAGDKKTIAVSYLKSSQPMATDLPAHPRVWMTPVRLANLRAQAAANSIRWQGVKATADAEVAKGTAPGDTRMLPDLCAVYLVTGDQRYATRAGVLITNYATTANNLHGDSGYEYRFWMPLVTMGLDWCYNGLTVGQRHQAASWLMDQADWVWPETNASRTNAWGLYAGSNYYWGFMMTGPAALAAAGDDTVTGSTSGPDRPAFHRQLAMTHWNSSVLPYFSSDGAGGAWAEGTNYDSSWFVGRFVDAFATIGAPLSTTWLDQSLHWRLASTMPGGVYKAPLGDQSRVSDASMYAYDRMQAMAVLPSANSSVGPQIQGWLNQIGQVPTAETETSVLAEELVRYDPSAPASDLSALPKDYLAPGAGYFTYRQSWTDPESTMLVFESGPISTSHAAEDANGLRIWKGSFWVSADANITSASGIEQATQNYNNLTVDTVTQNHNDGSTGQIVATQISPTLVVVRGQASTAYGRNDRARPIPDYLRTVAYLPQQDVIVVVDRATSANAGLTKTWRWHTQGVPQVTGNTFVLQNPAGDARCFGSVLLPTDAVLGTQTFSLASGGAVSSHAVTVKVAAGRATDLVVTVLQCTTGLSVPLTPVAVASPTQTMVTIGTWRVTVPADDAQPVAYDAASIIRD